MNDYVTTNDLTVAYQAQTHGSLHHSYLGFLEINKILYLLDKNLEFVDQIEVTAGLQSDWYYIATGKSLIESKSYPSTLDSIEMGSSNDWVEFGKDDSANKLIKYAFKLGFKAKAEFNEANTIKYVSWNKLIQKGVSNNQDGYAELKETRVLIFQAADDKAATLILGTKSQEILPDSTSLPISLDVTYYPTTDITVQMNVQFDQDEQTGWTEDELNSFDSVIVVPQILTFQPWGAAQSFQVKVNSNWNFQKGTSFRVNFTITGTNEQSYTVRDFDYIKFNVVRNLEIVNQTVSFIPSSLLTETFGFEVQAQSSVSGILYWLVLPSGQVGPTSGQEIEDWGSKVDQRRLQQSNITIPQTSEQVTLSEMEIQNKENYKIHLQSESYHDSIVIYDQTQNVIISYSNDEGDSFFWQNTDYTVYAAIKDLSQNWSPVAEQDFKTQEQNEVAWSSCYVQSDQYPSSTALKEIVCSYTAAIDWSCNYTIWKDNWIFTSSKRRLGVQQTYEIVVQLLADPSGEMTSTPSNILQAAEECSQCDAKFQDNLLQTSHASKYVSQGYNTGSSKNIQTLSQLTLIAPIIDYNISWASWNSIDAIFKGYENHYIFVVLIENTNEENFLNITSTQILYGLDSQNTKAFQTTSGIFPDGENQADKKEITEVRITFDQNLKQSQEYVFCAVSINGYTSITQPLSGEPECYRITTSKNGKSDGEDLCVDPNCFDSAMQLIISLCLLITILL